MRRCILGAVIWSFGLLFGVQSDEASEALLARIRTKVKEDLARVPDYVCLQTVERWARRSPEAPLELVDTLRLEVGFVGDKEIFAWRGADRFEEKKLADMIGSGVVGTGSFAVHANNVFLSDAAGFTYRGRTTLNGQHTIRFDYEVPQNLSRYRVRVPLHEAVVACHGSFWVNAETLDLIRLEVHAEDIPPELQLARISDVMEYARVRIGPSDFLLPRSSELTMVWVYGRENRNRRQLSGCRRYTAESTLSFDETPAGPSRPRRETTPLELPPLLPVELSLDSEIDLESAALGDPIRAVLLRPLMDGGRILVPQGAVVLGRLVGLDKQASPVPHYVVSLEFHTLEFDDVRAEFSATMEDAAGADALIRQAKRMDPTFSRRRSPRLDILVRERRRGQGVLHWKAQQPRIRRGLRMRWLTDPVR